MRFRYLIVFFLIQTCHLVVSAQVMSHFYRGRGLLGKSSSLIDRFEDSLMIFKLHLDSLDDVQVKGMQMPSTIYSRFFLPMTYYRDIVGKTFNLQDNVKCSPQCDLNNILIYIYLNRPDLVVNKATALSKLGTVIDHDGTVINKPSEIVNKVAPTAVEPEIVPMDIVVKKPNFWTYSGDYFLQFLQNYVSGNWYKGGESNFSMVGSAVLQVNYNNKQKVKWDNKLELKLGYRTSRGDTLHRYKTSEDLIRYTSKLGLQASKKWYYTIQMIANTQFTHSYKSNDPKVYSDFLSPLNVNFSVGMDYAVSWLDKRLTGSVHLAPFAYNFKYVERLNLAKRYGLDEGKHTLNDFGSQFDIDLTWKLTDNIKWKTRLYGYTTYKRAELEWENTFTFQFNRYISTNIFVFPRFDDGSERDEHHGFWQLKEYASIGFSYSF